MLRKTVTTEAGPIKYEVTFQAFESIQEAFDAWTAKGDNPEEVCLGILNAAQEQNAKQGGKTVVRKALVENAPDSEEVAEAIGKAQEYAAGYIIGSPRGGTLSSGITKTAAKDMGVALASKLGAEELAAIMADHGITL